MTRSLALAVVLLGAAGPAVGQIFPAPRPMVLNRAAGALPAVPKVTDAKALEAAGLKPDDPGLLLTYFRQRTLSTTDLGRIQAVIRRFAEDDFDERLKASAEAERFGPAAVGPLRAAAQSDPDPEVAYRAGETLKRLEKVPHAAVSLAAARALAKLKPADAAGVLLRFLPMADDDAVADEIRKTLVSLAVRDGQPDPALVAGLADPIPVCRAAAGLALIEGGPADRPARIPGAIPKVWSAVRVEADADTKFQLVFALLTVAREKEAVPALIGQLPDLPRGRLWQAEDYLLQLAGPKAPKAVLGKTPESLAKARDAWNEWWAGAAAGTDLAAYRYTPRIGGKTLLVLNDFRYDRGVVAELGPDMKERWRITELSRPVDAQVQADGTVVVAEQNAGRVTIRDTDGRVLATRGTAGLNRVRGPVKQAQVLTNGNLLVVYMNGVAELKKGTDEVVMQHTRLQYDVLAGRRLADGTTAVVLQSGNPGHVVFLDIEGKEMADRKLRTGPPNYQATDLDSPGPDRLLITEQRQVVEYDLKTNKAVWTKTLPGQPRAVQRLPNGNTLVVTDGGTGQSGQVETGRLIEVTPDGEEVWTYQPTGKLAGLVVTRAYRR